MKSPKFNSRKLAPGRPGVWKASKRLLLLTGYAGPLWGLATQGQDRESLAGESAAQALKESGQAEAQQYDLQFGPLGLSLGSKLNFSYTDNAFYSQYNRKEDFIINPEVDLGAFLQVSELNTLRLSLGVGYEDYLKNYGLNPDAPLVNPGSELVFNVFVGDVHIRAHEKFAYQQTLFINTDANEQNFLYNFNNVGTFTRWDNLAGLTADWDLNKVILSAGYDHENFSSSTSGFEYLDRSSEWFTTGAAFPIGDQVKLGVEGQAGWHDYDTETVLNDHWQARSGPYVEFKLPAKITFRSGGGYDAAWYDTAGDGSDFSTYYVYGTASQETRFFTHALSAGREHELGDNANNLASTYIRYSISTVVIKNVELGVNGGVNFDREFGGPFMEKFHYYVVGFKAAYQFHKHWRADLAYEYILKNESDLALRDFSRNRVTLGVTWTF